MWPRTTAVASLLLAETTLSLNLPCPNGEAKQQISMPGDTAFAVCEQADLAGVRTIQTLDNMASVGDCARACERAPGCGSAVFDTVASECYIKPRCAGRNAKVVASPRHATIFKMGSHYLPVGAGSNGTAPQSPTSSIPSSSSSPTFSTPSSSSSSSSPVQVGGQDNITTSPVSTTTSSDTVTTSSASIPASPVFTLGKWSDLIDFPLIPVAAYIVPAFPVATRLLAFSSWDDRRFGGGQSGRTQFADYDYTTSAISHREVANTEHDMFCPGMSTLADGRMVVTGGANAAVVSIYDPTTNEFTKAKDMNFARGYQSSVTLSDGRIFTIGGSWSGGTGNKTGEVYDPATGDWTVVSKTDPWPLMTVDHEGAFREDNHAWLFGWKNGSVFQAGPSKAMNWYTTDGQGSQMPAGRRQEENDQMCGPTVMYDAVAGKVLNAGGAQDYDNSDATNRAFDITIPQQVGGPARVDEVKPMKYARGFANSVVLPSGQVVVTGGQKRSVVFTDTDGALEPEMWDPATREWSVLAATPSQIARNYHSVSLLLSDGAVFVGGGGMCYGGPCDLSKDHLNGEVFFPPYLFARDGTPAKRPEIKSMDKQKVKVGETIAVAIDGEAAAAFVMCRMGSATHSINTDQRRVPLADVVKTDGGYSVTLPSDSGVVIPGAWYLFAMSKDGVPSIAWTVMVNSA